MPAVTICSDFGAKKYKVFYCFHCCPSICHKVMGTGCHNLKFSEMLSFKPTFSLSYFTLIKRLFSSSLPSAIRLVSPCIKGWCHLISWSQLYFNLKNIGKKYRRWKKMHQNANDNYLSGVKIMDDCLFLLYASMSI
jgi:hypothetical protein